MIQLYNCDCMEYMAKCDDNQFDLAIVDPPYGININNNIGRRKGDAHSGHKKVRWDSEIPNKDYFNELYRISRNQIIWGANYFYMEPTKCFIVWRKPKISENVTFSMLEYAWASFDSTSKEWIGIADDKFKIHPTQKPVKLYKWLLKNYAKEGDKIFDSHLGSGSIAIACHDLKYDLVGCELDKEYYNAAKERLKKHQSQLTFI